MAWTVSGKKSTGDHWCLIFDQEPTPLSIATTLQRSEHSKDYELGRLSTWQIKEV